MTRRATATERLTVAQALVRFLAAQHVERDGVERPFFAGVLRHLRARQRSGDRPGAAAVRRPGLRYYQSRNEQAQVHAAAGYARMTNRLQTLRLHHLGRPRRDQHGHRRGGGHDQPAPGAAPSRRRVRHPAGRDPVLQQLEAGWSQDVSVNDAFRPVSRYWDRISRPEQLILAALEAMRVLTIRRRPARSLWRCRRTCRPRRSTGRTEFLRERTWHVPRPLPDPAALVRAVEAIRRRERPLIVAGGGVIYSEATEALRALAETTGIPVAETQAGKGALSFDHPSRARRDGSHRHTRRQPYSRARPTS